MQKFIEKYKHLLITLFSLLFLTVNIVLIIEKDFYWFLGLPLIVLLIYYSFFKYDVVLLLIVLCTPLAVNLSLFSSKLGVSVPTEPLLVLLVLLFILRACSSYSYDWKIIKHPLSLIIICQLLWMFITSLSSEIPVISFKYLAARIWFVVPMIFMIIPLFRNLSKMKMLIILYMSGLFVVIIYTVFRHSQWGFAEEAGHWVMTPFYNDHTAYGAALALFLPALVGFSFERKINKGLKVLARILLVVFIIALVLSFSRAAWISVVAALGVYFLIKFRIRLGWILAGGIVVVLLFFNFQDKIIHTLKKNQQESSENMMEHVQSISNISSDASNLERINRWQAALRLFKERPVLGWGPGTYMFVYAPYQKSKEKTIISTNAANMGSVHSEFLGPLAEMGIPALILTILLLIYVFVIGIRVYYQSQHRIIRLMSLVTVLGLVSYFSHGLLNNFLETDKLAVPVYGFISIIIALDLYHKEVKV